MVAVTKAASIDDAIVSKQSILSKLSLFFILIGIASLLVFSLIGWQDKSKALLAYVFGFVSAISLPLGALAFVLIQHLTRAGWSVVVRRIAEKCIALFPLFALLFLPIAYFLHDIYPWTHEEHIDDILIKKLPYLNDTFFLIRSFSYLIIWSLLGYFFCKQSTLQDKGGAFNITKTLQAVSAPGIIIFGLSITFAAFDWIMSLEPHWYSTIFGVYYFAGSLLFALAFISIIAIVLQKSGYVKTAIKKDHYHDLGKLKFGFTVFWAYIAFSQFMLIWYGAIPEEVEYYSHRLHGGYEYISYGLPIFKFLIPFFLLMSRTLKKNSYILLFNAIWVIVVHFIDLYWAVMPNVKGSHGIHLTVTDFLPLIGMLCLFIGCYFLTLVRTPLLPIGDPRLRESLNFENF